MANGHRSIDNAPIALRTDGRWCARVGVRAKTKYVYGKSREEVVGKLERLKEQLGLPLETASNALTFEAFAAEYLRVKFFEVCNRTHQNYAYELGHYVFPYLGDMLLTDIKARHIRDMQIEIAEDIGVTSATHARKLAYSVLRMAMVDELIPRNPADGVAKLRDEIVELRIWNADEVRAFLEAAKDGQFYPMFYLALMTGLRPGELCALEWSSVSKDRIYVKQTVTEDENGKPVLGPPKSRAGRRFVPLTSDAKAVLDQYSPRKRTGFVFPSTSGTFMNFANVRFRGFVPAVKKAQLRATKPYVMRHTYASMLIKAGMDGPTVARWMGHADSSFTSKHYVHAFDSRRALPEFTLAKLLQEDETPTVDKDTHNVAVHPQGDAQNSLKAESKLEGASATTLRIALSPAQREALLRGEPLTLELGAG